MFILKPDVSLIETIRKTDDIDFLIQAVQKADSTTNLINATQNLANANSPYAIPTLLEILSFNNPGAAVAAVDGLVTLGERAVLPLLRNLDQYNYGARAWGVRALALIGDIRGIEILENALRDDIGPSVRRAAAKGLGNLKLTKLPLEYQNKIRIRSLTALEVGCHDAEWVVRYAVTVGLELAIIKNLPDHECTIRANRALQYLSNMSIPVIKERAMLGIQTIRHY